MPDKKLLTRYVLVLRIIGAGIILAHGVLGFLSKETLYLEPIDNIRFPLEVLTAPLALLLLCVPRVALSIIEACLPSRLSKRLRLPEAVREADKPAELPDLTHPTGIAQHVVALSGRFDRSRRRLFAVSGSLLLILTVLGMVVVGLNSKLETSTQTLTASTAAFERSRVKDDVERLCTIVQQSPLALSNADHARPILRRLSPFRNDLSLSVRSIHDILSKLWGDDVVDLDVFDSRVADIYHKWRSDLFVTASDVDHRMALLHSTAPCADIGFQTLVTLLVSIFHRQGNEGAYQQPYVDAAELLSLLTDAERSQPGLSGFHNAVGVNCVQRLKALSGLIACANDPSSAVVSSPTGSKPVAAHVLDLARRAFAAYELAEAAGSTFFEKARAINNKVDLSLYLVVHFYICRRPLDPRDGIDADFIISRLGAKKPEATPQTSAKLAQIMRSMLTELDRASHYAREGAIFFTRAQLLCVSGQLMDRKFLTEADWMGLSDVTTRCVDNLTSARGLHIRSEFFREDNALALLLDWIWTRANPEQRSRLSELAR